MPIDMLYLEKKIPNIGPLDAKIMVIGEAPGEDEYSEGKPFVGPAGGKLNQVLGRNGIPRESIYISNLLQYRIRGNKFEYALRRKELQEGIEIIKNHILKYRPNVVVPMGKWPLFFITGKNGISHWHGSIIPCAFDPSIKCIPTYHPAAILYTGKLYPYFDEDFKRIKQDSEFSGFNYPYREYIINPSGIQLKECVDELTSSPIISADIESVKKSTHILCVGFSPSESKGICIVPDTVEKQKAINTILRHNNKKIFQFGSFDYIMLTLNNYEINDANDKGWLYYWDTFLAQHAMWPELRADLGYLNRKYTRYPYYKHSGKEEIPGDEKAWSDKVNREELYFYNCDDTMSTFAAYLDQSQEVYTDYNWSKIFEFEMSNLEMLVDLSMTGFYRDKERIEKIKEILLAKWVKKQVILNQLIGTNVNVKSPKMKDYFYGKSYLGLPARRNKEGKVTVNEDAIVSLINFCKTNLNKVKREDTKDKWKRKLLACKVALEIRGYRQSLSNYIMCGISNDDRVRSLYKAGTETGRLSASKFVDGTGYNMQTNPRDPIEYSSSDTLDSATMQGLLLQLVNDIEEDDE